MDDDERLLEEVLLELNNAVNEDNEGVNFLEFVPPAQAANLEKVCTKIVKYIMLSIFYSGILGSICSAPFTERYREIVAI